MTRTMLMVITLLVGCATGAVVREVVAPARAQGQAGPNYEYNVVFLEWPGDRKQETAQSQAIVTKLGNLGWRLSAVTDDKGNQLFYFERQAPAH